MNTATPNDSGYLTKLSGKLRLALLIVVLGFTALNWWAYQDFHDSILIRYPDPAQTAYRESFYRSEIVKAFQHQFVILFLAGAAFMLLPPGSPRPNAAELDAEDAPFPGRSGLTSE